MPNERKIETKGQKSFPEKKKIEEYLNEINVEEAKNTHTQIHWSVHIMPIWYTAHTKEESKGNTAIYTYTADKSSRQCNEHKCKVAAAPMSASSDVMAKPKILAMKRTIVHVYTKCVFHVTTKWTGKAKRKQRRSMSEREQKHAIDAKKERTENGKSLRLLIVVPPLELED